MLAFALVVYVATSIVSIARANNISCSAPEQCHHSQIHCASNESCFVSCTGRDSCRNSTIHCPITGDCTIHCRGSDSCWDSVINASGSVGHFNLLCQSVDGTTFDDQCRNIQIYGSTIDTNTADFNVTCNGDLRSCVSSSIYCAVSGRCNVICNGSSSCRWMTLHGPIHTPFAVHCNEDRSCFDAVIDGRYASMMDITGCKAYESCLDLTLYCPANVDENKRCFIEGNNNLGQDKYVGGTRIYAVNGFDDIHMNYSGNYYHNITSNYHHGGQIFCGVHYEVSCQIAADGWHCQKDTDYCNEIQPNTNIPSSSPTSTAYPTVIPTLFPSKPPTIVPTHSPVSLPSVYPSETPTILPSHVPTFVPILVSVYSTTDSVVRETANHPVSNDYDSPDTSLSLYAYDESGFNSKSTTDSAWIATTESTPSVKASSTAMNTTTLLLIIALSVLGVINIIGICYCRIAKNKIKSELAKLAAMQKSQELAALQNMNDYSPEGASIAADVEVSLDIDMPHLPQTLEGNRNRNIISPRSELLYGYLSPGVPTHAYINDDSGEDSHSSLYDGSRIESETTTHGANSVTSLIIPSVRVQVTS